MLNMVKGCMVPKAGELSEGYELKDKYIIANVNVEKIMDVFGHFIVMHKDESGYFILELPVKDSEETQIRPGVVEKTHKHVYYIDALKPEECIAILSRSGELLINDGISYFGFGYPESGDELMLDKYNVMTIYSPEIGKFEGFFEKHGIERAKKLITAPETFTMDSPGVARLIEVGGKTVYDLIDEYKDWGIYKAETREE